MTHNLEDTKKYPLFHKWLTANNINIYTQGISIKQGDTIVYKHKCYTIEKAREENVVPYQQTTGIDYNNPERRYVNSKTKFYIVKLEGATTIFQLQPSIDRDKPVLVEHRIPKYK